MRAFLALAISTQALAPKPAYWSAYELDPDGHNMEALCHGPGRA
jgi:hypothetical protein